MTGHTPSDLAYAAGYVLRYLLVCGLCVGVAGLIVSGIPEARRGRHG